MIPAFLGVVILMAAPGAVAVGLGLGLVIMGKLAGPGGGGADGVAGGGGGGDGVGGAWLVGWVTAPRGVVPLGEEIAFCGIDCHLHVSAVGVSRGESLVVRLRFRSDAKAADEFPGMLRFALRGPDGHRRAPAAGFVTVLVQRLRPPGLSTTG